MGTSEGGVTGWGTGAGAVPCGRREATARRTLAAPGTARGAAGQDVSGASGRAAVRDKQGCGSRRRRRGRAPEQTLYSRGTTVRVFGGTGFLRLLAGEGVPTSREGVRPS